jgi:uncharacterized tellurite resistance protein B-like protein
MLGFFEHQYLSYKKNHIRNLLALAKVDGHMHEKEEKLLFKIGKRYGLKERQIKELIEMKENYVMNIPDNHNDRMNLLYDLLLMVHADKVVDKNEIQFCEEAVKKLGMKKELVKIMLDSFDKGEPPRGEDWDEIKQEAKEKYLLK